MGVKLKLLLALIVLSIFPVSIMNIIASSKMNDTNMTLAADSTSGILTNQADNVNAYFEGLITSAKDIASSDDVRDFAIKSNSEWFSFPSDEDSDGYKEYTALSEKFSLIVSQNSSLKKMMIINNEGRIVVSTDSSGTGKTMENFESLFTLSQTNNGVSPFMVDSRGSSEDDIEFVIAKSIFSYDNIYQGIVYQLYSTSSIQDMISSTRLDKYTTCALMDSSGNVIEYPYKNLRKYNENAHYRTAGSVLGKVLTPSDGFSAEPYYYFDKGKDMKIIFTSSVSSAHWTMLACTDGHGLKKEMGKPAASLRSIAITIIVILSVLISAFVIYYTQPISEIVKILQKKKKGDDNVRFQAKRTDEFGLIGESFNYIFDEAFESEQRYRAIVEITNNIVFEVDLRKGTVFVSRNFNKQFSHRPKDDSMKESFLYNLRMHKDDKERYQRDLDSILTTANFMRGEYRVKSIYGDFIWVMIKATKFYNRDEMPTKIVGVIMDIDKEKKSELHLIQRASNDVLTQLYNREAFISLLSAAISEAAGKKTLEAMMFIDLDDFKFFNDQYGHACGDEVLKFVADTLKEITFEHGFAGRFGGDEFVMCLTNITLYGDAGKIAQEIINILGEGFISESTGVKLSIRCSIGIAFLRESGKTAEEVIAAADEAMYNIKKHGKSAFAYAKSPKQVIDAPQPDGDGGASEEKPDLSDLLL